jgi:hypothetical protein
MDVLSVLRLVGRHWRVTVPAALMTLLGLVAALQLSSPTYQATGSIVLLSPPEAPDVNAVPDPAPTPEVGQNPFARYGDLAVMADILARVMDSDSMRAEIEAQGITDYEVLANRLSRGPVIEVMGEEPTVEAAIRSTETVLTKVDAVLVELQQAEGADPQYFINSTPLEPPSTATAMYGSTLRAAIAALVVGLLCTLGLAVVAEAFAQRRTAPPITAARPLTSEAASLHAEGGASTGSSNGGRIAGRSGILPDLELARREPPQQKSERRSMEEQKSTPQTKMAQRRSAPDQASSDSPADSRRSPPTAERSP